MVPMSPDAPDPSLPSRLREFHQRLPLAGDPPNALLSLPDDRLLYLVALLRDTPQQPPAMSPEEWQEFLDLLRPHGVYPLLAYRLRSWPEDCRPPKEVTDYLDRLFLYAAARSMRAGRQIQTVVDALEAAGIPSVLLKGPALARTVYPDPAIRQSTDIDLLVRPADVVAAEGVLEGLGYTSSTKEFHISQHEYHHQVFDPPGNGMPLELHWSLDNAFDLFPDGWVDDVLSRRMPISSDDLSCDTLSPADHLLFLVFHNVFQHRSLRMDWISDSASLMKGLPHPEEWRVLIDRSVEHLIRIPLELAVTAVAFWHGLEMPEEFMDPSTWPMSHERERHLWRYALTRRTSVFSGMYLAMQGQPTMSEKLRYGFRFILPPAQMITKFRRSQSRIDLPLAHLRRWISILKYI